MALASYTDLQASIATWMVRNDLGAVIPDFIRMAESQIALDLRLRQQLSITALSTTVNYPGVELPSDFLEFANISINGTPVTYMPIEQMLRRRFTGVPTHYSLRGDELLLSVVPDTVYDLDCTYYGKFDPLYITPSNGLLANHPDVYLYASLVQGSRFVMNDERANYWGNLYKTVVDRLMVADRKAMTSGSPLTVQSV